MLKGVVGRVLEVYVRHVCMLRPLTDGGKMKITSDIAQVQYNIYTVRVYSGPLNADTPLKYEHLLLSQLW